MAQDPSQASSFRITLEVSRSHAGNAIEFDVPVPGPASRVLDALLYVREHLDASLGFRYSCRAGMCGSCAVVINDQEALSCQTSIGSLGTERVRVSPLRALPVLRDLMCDMTPFTNTVRCADAALRPVDPDRETLPQMPPGAPHRALIERQNGCISCAACYSACASTATQPGALGPAALNRLLMLTLDERDAKGKARLATVAGDPQVLGSQALGDGSDVCPVGVPLREGMVELKRLLAAEAVA